MVATRGIIHAKTWGRTRDDRSVGTQTTIPPRHEGIGTVGQLRFEGLLGTGQHSESRGDRLEAETMGISMSLVDHGFGR